jgi:hypothetical protein
MRASALLSREAEVCDSMTEYFVACSGLIVNKLFSLTTNRLDVINDAIWFMNIHEQNHP